jgi:dihydroneopterin aldolase
MFEIGLDLVVELAAAAAGDDLKATVDYGKVVATARQVFCGEPRVLVEAAAFDIARALLEKFPRIESVVVRVGKVAPPIAENLRAIGVEIEVKRGG